MTDPTTTAIVEALDRLSAACGLDRSESATERLFAVLAFAFNDAHVAAMDAVLTRSHNDGLCYDMRWPIAHAIADAVKITKAVQA